MTIHPFAFAGMHQIEQNEYVNTILGKKIILKKGNGKVSLDKLRLYIQNTFPKALIKNRKVEHVVYRHAAISVINEYKVPLDLTLKQIGSILGNQDHATVIHAIKCVEDWKFIKDEYRLSIYKDVREKLSKHLVHLC